MVRWIGDDTSADQTANRSPHQKKGFPGGHFESSTASIHPYAVGHRNTLQGITRNRQQLADDSPMETISKGEKVQMLSDNVYAIDAHRPRKSFRQLDCRRNPPSPPLFLIILGSYTGVLFPTDIGPLMLRSMSLQASRILSRRDLQHVRLRFD